MKFVVLRERYRPNQINTVRKYLQQCVLWIGRWRPSQERVYGVPSDHALMLCWPSYCDPFAKQALHHYRGDTVIYIGESAGGCCADDRFHRILRRDFEHAGSSPKHVTYWGIHCDLSIWRRKAPGAQAGDDAA